MPAITRQSESEDASGSRWRRVGWFVLLYVVSLVVVGAVIFLLRQLLDLVFFG